jgi:tetratricopeptide (TPR) repeat protein
MKYPANRRVIVTAVTCLLLGLVPLSSNQLAIADDKDVKPPATPSANEIDDVLNAATKGDKKNRQRGTDSSKNDDTATSSAPPTSAPDSSSNANADSHSADNTASSSPTGESDTAVSSSSSSAGMTDLPTSDGPTSSNADTTTSGSSPQSADSTFDEPTSSKNTSAAELNNSAVEAILKKDYKTAVPLLEQSLNLDPKYQKAKENLRAALYNWGMEVYDHHQYAKALEILEKASALIRSMGGKADGDLQAVMTYCQRHAQESGK